MTNIASLAITRRRQISPIYVPGQWLLAFLFAAVVLPAITAAPDYTAKQYFEIPAGKARLALKQFAAQAQREIMFPVDSVDGVKTNGVKGQMTAVEAIARMLAGTGLVAVLDEKTGAFAIRWKGKQ